MFLLTTDNSFHQISTALTKYQWLWPYGNGIDQRSMAIISGFQQIFMALPHINGLDCISTDSIEFQWLWLHFKWLRL